MLRLTIVTKHTNVTDIFTEDYSNKEKKNYTTNEIIEVYTRTVILIKINIFVN